jgi:phage tail-like protein
MTQVVKPRKIIMQSRFRVEIDDIGDFRAMEAGPLKITFNISVNEEGGANTSTDMTVNGYQYEPVVISRPLTDDDVLAEWVEQFKRGIQDRRNGAVYALDTEGKDFYRWPIEEFSIADYEEFQGNAKSKEDSMMERITLKYRERGKRERLQ